MKKVEMPLAGQTRADGKRHKTKKKRKSNKKKKKKKKKKVLTSGISVRKVFEIGACRVRPPDFSCERTQIGVSERGSALEARFESQRPPAGS